MITLAGTAAKSTRFRELKTAWLDNDNAAGEILLFIHGYLDTPATWSPQAAAFADKYRVILPFARGVGPSEPPKDLRRYGAYSILLDHLELLRAVDPAGERPIHVVGHDVGGVHAWMLACHPHPRIKTVTILNSAHPRQYLRRLLWPRQLFKSWYMGAFQVPYVCEALLWLFHKEFFKILSREGWEPPQGELSLDDFEGAVINAMNQYRQFVRDIPHFMKEKAKPVQVPVLVISSEQDRYLEAPTALELKDIAAKPTLRVVRGKHWLHREQPERINRLLAEFWAQNHGSV
ncbi:MAG: alpha/beta fold hydrolase [Elusimicrobia bacterium]|nr:alpha/beta fold hydrolase [Elusimicrobiota bacterium]